VGENTAVLRKGNREDWEESKKDEFRRFKGESKRRRIVEEKDIQMDGKRGT